MKLSKNFTTVTPISKLIAGTLFILLPLVAFLYGMQYGQTASISSVEYLTKVKEVPVYQQDSPESLLSRCGDIPYTKLNIYQDRFTQVRGPFWSPDCRNIAWSVWQSGTMGMAYKGPYDHEGLFLYKEATGKIEKVYVQAGETIEIKEWKDQDRIVFTKLADDLYQYDLTTKSVTALTENQ